MRFTLPFMALATVFLVACEPYTPDTLNLPNPESIIIPNPATLDNSQLCAYAVKIEDAAVAWENYANSWIELVGKEPISFSQFASEYDDLEKLLEARRLTCVVETEE